MDIYIQLYQAIYRIYCYIVAIIWEYMVCCHIIEIYGHNFAMYGFNMRCVATICYIYITMMCPSTATFITVWLFFLTCSSWVGRVYHNLCQRSGRKALSLRLQQAVGEKIGNSCQTAYMCQVISFLKLVSNGPDN